MKARLEAENPENIEFTLSVTLPLKDWRRFSTQIHLDTKNGSYPGHNFKDQVRNMILLAERDFYPEINNEE